MTDPRLERLNDYFKNTPREQVEKDWNDLSKCGKVGQPINEFLNENIMNKLELKHIVGYLPYKLECKYKNWEKPFQIVGTSGKTLLFEGDWTRLLSYPQSHLVSLEFIKPILRPMSDLAKPCLDGKTPLVELAIIEGYMYPTEEMWHTTMTEITYPSIDGFWLTLRYDPQYGFIKFSQELNKAYGVANQPKLYDYLYKNHFDIYGLIEQNLAININTL